MLNAVLIALAYIACIAFLLEMIWATDTDDAADRLLAELVRKAGL